MTLSDVVRRQELRCPSVRNLQLRNAHYTFLNTALTQEQPSKSVFDPQFVDYDSEIDRDQDGKPVRKLATASDLSNELPRRQCARAWARYRLREFYESPQSDQAAVADDIATQLRIGGAERTAQLVPQLLLALYALAVDKQIEMFSKEQATYGLNTAAKRQYQHLLPEVKEYVMDQFSHQ